MSDRNQMVGLELTRFSYQVERGKIRELVQAIGDNNPLYTDPAYAKSLGYRDIIAPPTFGTCIELWGGRDFMALCDTLKLNPVKILHGEQSYQYLEDIYPGDTIEAVGVLKNYVQKGKMDLFTIETVYRNQSGATVLIARSTIIERQ